jgi:hypothetical protein
MFQFARFASFTYVFSKRYHIRGGFPHSEIHGSKPVGGSPWLIAAYYVLHRLSVPRHPPDALTLLNLCLHPKMKTVFPKSAEDKLLLFKKDPYIQRRSRLAILVTNFFTVSKNQFF